MEDKHVIGLILLLLGGFGGITLACISKRIRDLLFFLLVLLAPFAEQMQVNFVSREWYRGTTRGFEFCGLDVLAVSVLVSSVLFPRRGQKRLFWPASLGLMILFLLFSALCVAMSDPRIFGLFALSKLIRGIVVFLAAAMFVRGDREMKLLVLALCFTVGYEAILAIIQRYHGGIDRVYGTLDDSNSLSMYFCTTAPIFVAAINSRFPKLLKLLSAAAVAMACIGVILTISRAGVVTIAIVLLGTALFTVPWRLTLRRVAIASLVSLAALGVTARAWNTLKARFGESSLRHEYEDMHAQGRGYYFLIARTIVQDRVFGVGPNNWSYWVSNRYGPRLGWKFVPYHGTDKEPSDLVPSGGNVDEAQAAPAHSLAALTAGETGLGGLFIFTLLWLRWFQMGITFLPKRSAAAIRPMAVGLLFCILGNFSQSFTEWVFYQTPIYFTILVLIGALAGLYHQKKVTFSKPASREIDAGTVSLLAPTPF